MLAKITYIPTQCLRNLAHDALRVGDTFAAEIVAKMWAVYNEKDHERRAMMQSVQGMKMNDLSEMRKGYSEEAVV